MMVTVQKRSQACSAKTSGSFVKKKEAEAMRDKHLIPAFKQQETESKKVE